MQDKQICALCRKPAVLQKSHAIPDAVFRDLFRDNGGYGVSIPVESGKIYLSNNSESGKLLCADCERKLNSKYDAAAINFLRRTREEIKSGAERSFEFEAEKLAGFLLSVLWRQSNLPSGLTGRHEFNREFNEMVRNVLLNGTPSPLLYGAFRVFNLVDRSPEGGLGEEDLRSLIMMPSVEEMKAHYRIIMMFYGFLFESYISKGRIWSMDIPGAVQSGERIKICDCDLFSDKKIADLLVGAVRKYYEGQVTDSFLRWESRG